MTLSFITNIFFKDLWEIWKFSLNSPSLNLFQTTLFHKFLLHNRIQKLCMARGSITGGLLLTNSRKKRVTKMKSGLKNIIMQKLLMNSCKKSKSWKRVARRVHNVPKVFRLLQCNLNMCTAACEQSNSEICVHVNVLTKTDVMSRLVEHRSTFSLNTQNVFSVFQQDFILFTYIYIYIFLNYWCIFTLCANFYFFFLIANCKIVNAN